MMEHRNKSLIENQNTFWALFNGLTPRIEVPLIFVVAHFLFWVLVFQAARLTFCLFHFSKSLKIPFTLFFCIVAHGLRLDLATAAYASILPFFLTIAAAMVPARLVHFVNRVHVLGLLFLFSLLSVADLEIYRFWGCRIDASILRYLSSPREAVASASASSLVLLIGIFWVCFITFFVAYRHWIEKRLATPYFSSRSLWRLITVGLFLLLIMARGGLQQIPLNDSFAWFSHDDFANQVTQNVLLSFAQSLLHLGIERSNPYRYLDPTEAEACVTAAGVFSNGNARVEPTPAFLHGTRPNVIVIIWESLSALAVQTLGGCEGVTPGFDRLTKKGALFSRLYACGSRTCHGLMAILDGYPAQPHSPIISATNKVRRLPSLAKTMSVAGYSTSFFYGGEIEFDNMQSFLRLSHFERIVGLTDFSADIPRSKWGVPDHVVFETALGELKNASQPFFCSILTLSSHEPFDVPMAARFLGNDLSAKYKNALAYTDQALSQFIDSLEREPWYDKTLVIIVADHGTGCLGDLPRYSPERYRIPMLWLGGALAIKGCRFEKICSQGDLARTLLNQLHLPSSEFRFSRDLFDPTYCPSAHFTFNEGVGQVTERGSLAFDSRLETPIYADSGTNQNDLKVAKSYLQETYQDYFDR